jgi:hypothetical protein
MQDVDSRKAKGQSSIAARAPIRQEADSRGKAQALRAMIGDQGPLAAKAVQFDCPQQSRWPAGRMTLVRNLALVCAPRTRHKALTGLWFPLPAGST